MEKQEARTATGSKWPSALAHEQHQFRSDDAVRGYAIPVRTLKQNGRGSTGSVDSNSLNGDTLAIGHPVPTAALPHRYNDTVNKGISG